MSQDLMKRWAYLLAGKCCSPAYGGERLLAEHGMRLLVLRGLACVLSYLLHCNQLWPSLTLAFV